MSELDFPDRSNPDIQACHVQRTPQPFACGQPSPGGDADRRICQAPVTWAGCGCAACPLRLVRIPHPGGKKRPFLIVSSLLGAAAKDIAEGYRRRWSIELIFKWIKQNLKIKRFPGESRNAVAIQTYTAIIAYIPVRMYHRLFSNGKTSFARCHDIAGRKHLPSPTPLPIHPSQASGRLPHEKNTLENGSRTPPLCKKGIIWDSPLFLLVQEKSKV